MPAPRPLMLASHLIRVSFVVSKCLFSIICFIFCLIFLNAFECVWFQIRVFEFHYSFRISKKWKCSLGSYFEPKPFDDVFRWFIARLPCIILQLFCRVCVQARLMILSLRLMSGQSSISSFRYSVVYWFQFIVLGCLVISSGLFCYVTNAWGLAASRGLAVSFLLWSWWLSSFGPIWQFRSAEFNIVSYFSTDVTLCLFCLADVNVSLDEWCSTSPKWLDFLCFFCRCTFVCWRICGREFCCW